MRATVLKCEETAEGSGIFSVDLSPGEERLKFKPGQFITIEPLNPLSVMPRPFSVCFANGDRISILFKVVGPNTEAYARLKSGEQIEIFGPKGNPIPLDPTVENYILVGGARLVPNKYFKK